MTICLEVTSQLSNAQIRTHITWYLTALHAIVRIRLDIGTIILQVWIQQEECLDTDSVFSSQRGTRVIVDVRVFGSFRVPTVDLSRIDVSIGDEGADGDRHSGIRSRFGACGAGNCGARRRSIRGR